MGSCSDLPPFADLLHSPFRLPPSDDCPRRFLRQGSTGVDDGTDALMTARERQMGSDWGSGSGSHRRRRRKMRRTGLSTLLLASTAVSSVNAAFVPFKNCLDDSIVHSDPLQLQFVPLLVSASIDPSSDSRSLDVTVYGNVSGLASQQPYPPPDDPAWEDRNKSIGKIVGVDKDNNKYSTLFAKLNVLSFTPYIADPAKFCDSVTQGDCPLGPVFNVNGYVLNSG